MKKYPLIDWKCFYPCPVIGVDEAGRGCLAGPVFSAAVILKKDEHYPDSKQVSPEKRKQLAQDIMNKHIYTTGTADVYEIENLNILQASLLSMKRALLKLSIKTGHVLVDGRFLIPNLPYSFRQTTFIKGDQRLSPIAAASIIAKVRRDEWMEKQDKYYPKYGFLSHKGYATVLHRKAIAQYGPCPLHRKSFTGVKEYIR
ncbi:MAG: ribonuclease HII [Bdellovibrionales bacterium]|nr:ribonuclease HII [Bdellovibrionales bacterium]